MQHICGTVCYNDNIANKNIIKFIKEQISKNNYIYNGEIDKNISLSKITTNTDKILVPVIIFDKSGKNLDTTFVNTYIIDKMNAYFAGNDSDYTEYKNTEFNFDGNNTLENQTLENQFNNLINNKGILNIKFYLKEIRSVFDKLTLNYQNEPNLETLNNDIKKTNNIYDLTEDDIEKYLPIWIIDDLLQTLPPPDNIKQRINGYAPFPWWWSTYANSFEYVSSYNDGVVICYNTINTPADSQRGLGKTLVHELGHWFGLYHTFASDTYDNNAFVDTNDNGIIDDGERFGDCIIDTPAQANKTFGNPFTKLTAIWPKENNKLIMFFNHMDYSDDKCRIMFTNEQTKKMKIMRDRYRDYLKTGNMFKNIINSINITNYLFSNDIYYVKNNSSIEFSASYHNDTYIPDTIQWNKNSNLISGQITKNYQLSNNNTINGIYNFIVTNNIETYTSNSIQLKYLKINNIQISTGTLSNLYNPFITSYSASVSNNITSIIVTITKNNTDASVKINNIETITQQINLDVGNNTINILASVNNESDENYTINVTRNALIKSNDATLKSIKVSTGKLIPTFKSTTTQYKINVKSIVKTFYIIPTKNNIYATIKVNNKTVNSGKKSSNINLKTGNNVMTIVVTAQNGTKRTYKLTIIRSKILTLPRHIQKTKFIAKTSYILLTKIMYKK